MSKKPQEKAVGEPVKQPDQSGVQGQQEQQTPSDQDKQPDQSGQGQTAGDEGQQGQVVQDDAPATDQPQVNDRFKSLVRELIQESPLFTTTQSKVASAEEINEAAVDIRHIVTIRTLNVPNNRRYRGGICFTDQGQPVNLDDLTEEQFKAIMSDPYLRKE